MYNERLTHWQDCHKIALHVIYRFVIRHRINAITQTHQVHCFSVKKNTNSSIACGYDGQVDCTGGYGFCLATICSRRKLSRNNSLG